MYALFNVGLVVTLAGGLLVLGNQTGFFPTFPFAGFLVMGVGGILIAIGRSGINKSIGRIIDNAGDLLKDERYTTAVKMAVADAEAEGATQENVLDRATKYLIENGVPETEAKPNLQKVLAAYLAGSAAIEINKD